MTAETKIHVFVNRQKVDLDQEEITGEQLRREAGFEGREWDLFKLQGEGGPSGGQLVLFNGAVPVKNGDHFRVIPGNRTFGA